MDNAEFKKVAKFAYIKAIIAFVFIIALIFIPYALMSEDGWVYSLCYQYVVLILAGAEAFGSPIDAGINILTILVTIIMIFKVINNIKLILLTNKYAKGTEPVNADNYLKALKKSNFGGLYFLYIFLPIRMFTYAIPTIGILLAVVIANGIVGGLVKKPVSKYATPVEKTEI